MVDFWNVMFPAGQYVTYDDEAGVLRCSDHGESRYANHD
jgi:hypothetical protein